MNPFAVALRQLRAELEISQGQFAASVGIRQDYLSALECGSKLPRDSDLIGKIAEKLSLDADQVMTLNRAVSASKRSISLPLDAPASAYRYLAKLSDAIPQLTPAHFRTLSAVLESLCLAPIEGEQASGNASAKQEVAM